MSIFCPLLESISLLMRLRLGLRFRWQLQSKNEPRHRAINVFIVLMLRFTQNYVSESGGNVNKFLIKILKPIHKKPRENHSRGLRAIISVSIPPIKPLRPKPKFYYLLPQ